MKVVNYSRIYYPVVHTCTCTFYFNVKCLQSPFSLPPCLSSCSPIFLLPNYWLGVWMVMSLLVLPLDRFFYTTYDFNNSMCYFLCKLSSSLLTPHVKEYLYISHEPMLLFLCHCWHFHCIYGRYWNPSVSKWVLPYRSNKKAIWLAKCREERAGRSYM